MEKNDDNIKNDKNIKEKNIEEDIKIEKISDNIIENKKSNINKIDNTNNMNKNEIIEVIINNNGNKNENSFALKNDYKNKSNFENKNKYIYNNSIINQPNRENFSYFNYPYPSSSHIFEKRISKENKDNYNENPKLNNLQKIFIIVYYIFFGHIIISINIFNSDSKNKEFILLCLLLYEFAYFFIQIMINVFMLFVYIIKLGFNSFLFKFYNMIKYKKKKNIY